MAEVGAGTGGFLSLFASIAKRLVAVDLTEAMLRQARRDHAAIELVVADGAQLPFADGSIDLVASAQMLHHVPEPVPILKEMRRVVAPDGWILIVDQVASERYEEARAMTELDALRDPSHAVSRPPSAFQIMLRAAGLEVVDQRVVESANRLSSWMWPGEFPQERIDAVRQFIETRGHETGMDFRRAGDDWVFTRRRMMLLVRRA